MDRVKWIETTLRRALAPSHLAVEDESEKHADHAGAAAGGGHFRVLCVWEAFRGQAPVPRHSAVYAALGPAMKSEIHALALRTLTREEWERNPRGA